MINPSPSININETMTRRIPRIISRCCAKIVQGNEKEKLIRIKRTFRSLPPFFKLIKNKNSQNKIYPLSSIQSKKSRLIVPLSQNKFFFSSPNSLSLSLSQKNSFSSTIPRNETLGLSRAVRHEFQTRSGSPGGTKGRWQINPRDRRPTTPQETVDQSWRAKWRFGHGEVTPSLPRVSHAQGSTTSRGRAIRNRADAERHGILLRHVNAV